jgi:molecular chaperone GrpE
VSDHVPNDDGSGIEPDPSSGAADEVLTDAEVLDALEADLADGSTIDYSDIDVASVVAERDQFKDIALRLQADFENYKKRVARDTGDEIDRRTGRLVESLLPTLDACEAAFAHGVEGVEAVWSSLIGVLQKQGLEAMDLAGKPFDPNDADAVAFEPGDGEQVVAEVMRTGYRWQGKVLRPAMVKVRG